MDLKKPELSEVTANFDAEACNRRIDRWIGVSKIAVGGFVTDLTLLEAARISQIQEHPNVAAEIGQTQQLSAEVFVGGLVVAAAFVLKNAYQLQRHGD